MREALIEVIEAMTGLQASWETLTLDQLNVLAWSLADGSCSSEMNRRIVRRIQMKHNEAAASNV